MTMREEQAVAGRCHPAAPGGDRSMPRADPRATDQEAMFLVTVFAIQFSSVQSLSRV